MSNRLLHNRRVDDHALHTCDLDHAGTFSCFDRLGQQLFNAGFA
jgi:hypothetical protein